MNNKAKTLIGFAVKSGKTLYGLENIERSKSKPFLVIYCESLGESALKKLLKYCGQHSVRAVCPDEMVEELTYRKNCKIIGLTDSMMAKGIIDSLAPAETGGGDLE